jgi:hypothetical protein
MHEDPRLRDFFTVVVPDEAERTAALAKMNGANVSFEDFIESVFTNKVSFDNTGDNSMALAQLGQYLENKRPAIDANLITRLETFQNAKPKKDMMHNLFIETLKGLTQ